MDLQLRAPKEYRIKLDVVFEDDFLAVINKSPGIEVSGNKFKTVENALSGKVADKGPSGLKKGSKVTVAYLEGLDREDWFKLRMHDDQLNELLEHMADQLKEQRKGFDARFEEKRGKITPGDDLAPGVL